MSDIRVLELNEIRRIHRKYMRNDFPRMELRPYFNMASLYRQGRYIAFGFYNGGRLTAYACLILTKKREYALLDYFAVLRELRGCGVGGRFLHLLIPEIPASKGVFVETESPALADSPTERDARQRRISFYEKNGAVETGCGCHLFGVDYKLLFLPQGTVGADKGEFDADLHSLYQEVYPQGSGRFYNLYSD